MEQKQKQQQQGVKYDNGKPAAGWLLEVFPNALMCLGKVIRKGQEKYPNPNNWKYLEQAEVRYRDALMRHLLKKYGGQDTDEETGLSHLAHAAWNALALLELELTKDNKDNERQ